MMEVTAAVIWQGNKFLICQRPREKYCGLLWEFPGGKIEPGETAEECIVRECREELGVTLKVHGEFYDAAQEHPDCVVHLHFFSAEIASGELTPLEHNAVEWVTQEETAGYEFCPADAKMLRENELGIISRDRRSEKMSKRKIYKTFKPENRITLFNKDCQQLLEKIPDDSVSLVVTSPPYCIGKAYEDPHDDIETFKEQHRLIFDELYRIVAPGGSLCWQVGYHISDTCVIPLDYIVYGLFTTLSANKDIPLVLRNRIIWTFGHGLNSTTRFSGRHETILWFTKGQQAAFHLDEVRVPQKYPGKKAYKGPHKGELSGNPLGKNPTDVWGDCVPEASTDVWDIPNVKAKHIEKTDHPCQFPVAIPRRLIKALTEENALVVDPFMGAGTTGVAAVLEKRRFAGAELQKSYYDTSWNRIMDAINGKAKIRPDLPVIAPNPNDAVAKLPEEFDRIRREKNAPPKK